MLAYFALERKPAHTGQLLVVWQNEQLSVVVSILSLDQNFSAPVDQKKAVKTDVMASGAPVVVKVIVVVEHGTKSGGGGALQKDGPLPLRFVQH
ncbi:hypothetical protein BpHYR1_054529 [Brachionus plicatilis]|uniref:Uncharacterized protein n=1 Tax=Brachionus plicatilis TaxID=10195 RepID=A0A3M7R2R8_BRAPC|nr:hypothetical protein BpHYR1_054529 [Brachionus plicatilis]